MAEVSIDGLDELGRALKQFPEQLGKKYLRKATFAATDVIRQDAEGRAPVLTGALKAHIAIFRRPDDPSTAHYAIGVRGIRLNKKLKRLASKLRQIAGVKHLNIAGEYYYWRMQELGWHDKKGVFHKNAFLRPAFEAQKMNALEAFRIALAQGVKDAAAEVAAK